MPRRLHLDDDALTIELSGLLALGTLHRRVRVPWTAVTEVRADALALRRARHGRFAAGRRATFLSFEDPARVVRIAIDRRAPGAPRLDEVVVGHAEPEWLVRCLRRRLPNAATPAVAAPAAVSGRARAA
jgi:hypothetical protein